MGLKPTSPGSSSVLLQPQHRLPQWPLSTELNLKAIKIPPKDPLGSGQRLTFSRNREDPDSAREVGLWPYGGLHGWLPENIAGSQSSLEHQEKSL